MNNLPKHHGTGPPEGRGPMQLHRLHRLKASPAFSIQLDESTDVSQCAQCLAHVRCMHDDAIREEFLFCEPLSETTKAADILQMVSNFFVKQDFSWKRNIGSLCTGGTPAVLGKASGFATLVKKEAPHIIVTHCFLHRHALASKTLIINFTRDIVYFCEVRQLHQSSSFEPSYVQKALARNGFATRSSFVSYRSLLAFERSSFEALDGTEKGSFIF